MISKKDLNQTDANSKPTQRERIFVTDENEKEREQNHNKLTDKVREQLAALFCPKQLDCPNITLFLACDKVDFTLLPLMDERHGVNIRVGIKEWQSTLTYLHL